MIKNMLHLNIAILISLLILVVLCATLIIFLFLHNQQHLLANHHPHLNHSFDLSKLNSMISYSGSLTTLLIGFIFGVLTNSGFSLIAQKKQKKKQKNNPKNISNNNQNIAKNDEFHSNLQTPQSEIAVDHPFYEKVSDIYDYLNQTYQAIEENNQLIEKTSAKVTKELMEKNTHLMKLSITDELTNLGNRRYFEDMLNNYCLELINNEIESITFWICDIDCFKSYNDTYGHLQGDECIKKVAQILSTTVYDSHIIARYGGEEFAIIMPNARVEDAKDEAERVLQRLEDKKIPHINSSVSDYVTLSIGIVEVTNDSFHSKDKLVETADNALYEAKINGRNCVVIAD